MAEILLMLALRINQSINQCNIKYNVVRPKMKFYLFGIAARPTEKLILFAFQTKKKLLLKKSESRRNLDCVLGVCSGF